MKGLVLRLILFLLPVAVSAAAKLDELGFPPASSNVRDLVSCIYIAPEDEFVYRMRYPNGDYHEFEKGGPLPAKAVKDLPLEKGLKTRLLSRVRQKQVLGLASPRDWTALMLEKDRMIYVITSENVVGGQAQYLFKNGRIIQFEQNGKVYKIPYEEPREPTMGGRPISYAAGGGASTKAGAAHAPKGPSKEVQRELKKKWAKTGRLRWPFENPNENGFLYLSLALLSTMLFYMKPVFGSVKIPLLPRRERFKLVVSDVHLVGGICFVAAFSALMLTASRGSLLALVFGLSPAIVLNFKKLVRSREVRILAALVVLMAVTWIAFHLSSFTRGFVKKSRRSNDTRIEMWTTAPQMMVEAPNGWEGMAVANERAAGRAYVDWYDSLSRGDVSGSLINDHLTYLVGFGTLGRFTYLFVWFVLLSLMTYTALRTKRAVALGVFAALAVASWFNPVLMNICLWGGPIIAFVLFLASRPWRSWRLRTVSLIVVGSALLAVATVAGIEAYGRMKKTRPYPIFVADGRVCVKDKNPDIWIADDKKALGRVSACRDIRSYYLHHPSAPAVGYVRQVEDLPKRKVNRLVLAGEMTQKWLDLIQKSEEQGEDVSQLLPNELVLISPSTTKTPDRRSTKLRTFLPSEVPEEIKEACKVRYVIGEFVAQYDVNNEALFKNMPAWVTVVPGMELYIPNWMDYVMKEFGGTLLKYDECSIYVENGQARVKGDNPNIWIVDDGKALGGVLSCSDIRWYYCHHPEAPAVGYVRRVENLPRKRVDRLVLAGEMGLNWLDWIRETAMKGEDVSRLFPKEIVFISPSFLPSDLPEGIEEACKVKYVIGEFVARYDADDTFVKPPKWVTVVPGMELYIQDWMRFAVE